MKNLFSLAARAALVSLITLIPFLARAEKQSGQVLIQAVKGSVTCSGAKGVWQPVKANQRLDCGVVIKTGADAGADLALGYNRTVLHLTPNSTLRVAQLDQDVAGEDVITEITLELLDGALAGSQRKLTLPSRLDIVTPNGTARIMGTEYYVRADGAVSVVSGAVRIRINQDGNGNGKGGGKGSGSGWVTVTAGYTYDPATMSVVPTTPAYLQNIIAHVETTRQNAETFKLTGGANLVVKPEHQMSPSAPKGNNGVGNGVDPQPPGNPPVNDGPGTGPGNPGNKGGS